MLFFAVKQHRSAIRKHHASLTLRPRGGFGIPLGRHAFRSPDKRIQVFRDSRNRQHDRSVIFDCCRGDNGRIEFELVALGRKRIPRFNNGIFTDRKQIEIRKLNLRFLAIRHRKRGDFGHDARMGLQLQNSTAEYKRRNLG